MAVDFLRKPLAVGDKVVFTELGYRNFIIGTVTRLTEKTAMVETTKNGYTGQTKQFHEQLIRIG